MRFIRSKRRLDARYSRIGPVFYSDHVVGVLDGEYVVGSVNRNEITAIRQQTRTSFKHPILGSIFGVFSVAASFLLLRADPIVGVPALFIGLYILWGVVRRRSEPWIVFRLTRYAWAFPLPKPLGDEEIAKLAALLPAAEQLFAPGYDPNRGRGFDVLPTKPSSGADNV